MSCHFLLQGIFPTQGSNLALLHCRQTLYHLSHQGSLTLSSQHLVQPGIIWFLHSFACLFSPLRIVIHIQQGSTVEPRELCSVLCGSLDGRGVWGRMDTCICICMVESFCCSPETSQNYLLISYTSIENKKFTI